MRYLIIIFSALLLSTGCSISFSGADTSGARTVSVDYFKPLAPSAGPLQSQVFTEDLKDLLLAQSSLDLVEEDGDLSFEGAITGYQVSPVAVNTDEVASQNRLTVTVKVKYTNSIEKEKSFEKNFSRFADFSSADQLLSVEADLLDDINGQLTQDIFNSSLGNW